MSDMAARRSRELIARMSPSQQGMSVGCPVREASDHHVVLHRRIDPIDTGRLLGVAETA